MTNSVLRFASWDEFKVHCEGREPPLRNLEKLRQFIEPIICAVFEADLQWWWDKEKSAQIRFGAPVDRLKDISPRGKLYYLGNIKSTGRGSQNTVTLGWNIDQRNARYLPQDIKWVQPDNKDSEAPWEPETVRAFIDKIVEFSRNHIASKFINQNQFPAALEESGANSQLNQFIEPPTTPEAAEEETSPVSSELTNSKDQEFHRQLTIRDEVPRDKSVVLKVLAKAEGKCALCGEEAHFDKEDGQPFLHVHHIEELSVDGADKFNNCVALHADCHAEAHYAHPKRRKKIKDELKAYRAKYPE